MTIHLVYARGIRTSAPHIITRELSAFLSRHYPVQVHDLAELRTLRPQPGDILLGHPHQDPRTVFASSFHQPGWAKRIVMCPYSHGIPEIAAWVDPYVEEADAYLAITGRWWFERMAESPYAHWQYKTRRVDLAVDPAQFPAVKQRWNSPGKRRFLYVGYTGAAKGTDYLAALAEANPDLHFAWMGGGFMNTPAIETLGPCDFNLPESLRLVAGHDFMITCGRSDANPTTILEALAWGLVPVCTPESGYCEEPWLVNIPLDRVEKASAVLRELNRAPESELSERIARGRAALARQYTWQRFGEEVLDALRSAPARRPTDAAWQARAAANRETLAKLAAARSGG